MLNYLRAEIYKLLHRQYFWIALVVLLGLEGCLVGSYAFTNAHGNHIESAWAISSICIMMSMGCFFTLLTGDMVFAQQYKNVTLKNEVSFGLPRARIYLGKLLTQLLASLLLCFVMLAFYVVACRLFLIPDTPEEERAALLVLGQCMLGAMPIWFGVQATVCACYFIFRTEIAAAFAAVGLFAILGNVLELVSLFLGHYSAGETVYQIYRHMPVVMLDNLPDYLMKPDYWPYLGKLCIVGGAWFVVSTAIGLWAFQRKEIN